MAYNFKSIADVEVVEKPVDTANVLIEEDGVVKKAPMSAVGGAGGGHWIMLNTADYTVTTSEGIYEALENFLTNFVPTRVDAFLYRHDEARIDPSIAYYIAYQDNEHDVIEVCDQNNISYYIHKDGNHEFYWD